MHFLRAENLSFDYVTAQKLFGRRRPDPDPDATEEFALRDINLDVEHGERLGIIGGNGSGKTTLLKILSGLLPPTGGSVSISTEPTSLLNIQIGMNPTASGERNIYLRCLALGMQHDEIVERTPWISEFSGLGHYLERRFDTYSAGMKMRLKFAIATAFQPEILILDEWLSAGDLAFKNRAFSRMEEISDEAGLVVVATHSKQLLHQVCTKAIWINDGQIAASGGTKDVYEQFEAYMRDLEKDQPWAGKK